MARKQVIVQLDDDLVGDLDILADHLGINRSELLRRAARMILDAGQTAILEEQHRQAYLRVPDSLTFQDGYASGAVAQEPPHRARKAQ